VIPAVETLLPHRGAMLLVESVLEVDAQSIECRGRILAAHPTVAAGRAPAILGLEMGAQAAGLHAALQARAADPAPEPVGEDGKGQPAAAPRLGYLVGIRQARFDESHLPVDVPLRVTAKTAGALAALALCEITVRREGESATRPLVQGTVSTYAL